jgi:ATP-dependent helicase HrpB
MLLHEPDRIEQSTVILDEFHERSVEQDLCYALLNQYVDVFDDQLKRVVMSATLSLDAIVNQTSLQLIESKGFSHPVTLTYRKTDVTKSRELAQFIESSWQNISHHLLVFCPGIREIRRIEQALSNQIPVVILHGQLDKTPNIQLLENSPPTVILATNIAESSVTLPNVHTVIDLGLERFANVNPATGLTELKTRKISKASATQRAGRAGRLGPGNAIRLWSEDQQDSLVSHQPAELTYADLTATVLNCAVWGASLQDLPWLEAPSDNRWKLATETLMAWNAIGKNGAVTEHGKAMLKTGLEPWLGHFMVTAYRADNLPPAAALAASLTYSELDNYDGSHPAPISRLSKSVRSEANLILKRFNLKLPETIPAVDSSVLVTALADRLIHWTSKTQGQLVNGTAVSSRNPSSKTWGILLDGMRQSGQIQVNHSLPMATEQVLSCVKVARKIEFNPTKKTFTVCSYVGKIKLDQKPIKPSESEKTDAWANLIATQGESVLNWPDEANDIKARWLFAVSCDTTWPKWPDNFEWAERCKEFMAGVTSFNKLPLMAVLEHTLGQTQLNDLNQQYPKTWQSPTQRNVKIHYDATHKKATAEIKLQEAFGLNQTPTVGKSQPVELALLAPNQRPVANVTDLPHFWRNVYPEVRKELRGRYAKHPWPEDPMSFQATTKTNRQIKHN